MYCENCGARIDDHATYCDGCGNLTNKAKYSRSLKKYRIACVGLALLCIGLLILSLFLANKAIKKGSSTEDSQTGPKIVLCGVYTVGVDDELSAGMYNITPAQGEREVDITFYPDKTSFDEEQTSGIKSHASRWLDGKSIKGIKLREGNILEIYEPGAVFEKID